MASATSRFETEEDKEDIYRGIEINESIQFREKLGWKYDGRFVEFKKTTGGGLSIELELYEEEVDWAEMILDKLQTERLNKWLLK